MTDLHPDVKILNWNTHGNAKLRRAALRATAKRSKPNPPTATKIPESKASMGGI
jgi:hypothetical protein